jgi:hypothetical protein
MDTQEPVVVYTVTELAHAELIKSFLESENIPATINAPATLPGVEDIEILVRASDADRAAELLEEHEISQSELADEEEFESEDEEEISEE